MKNQKGGEMVQEYAEMSKRERERGTTKVYVE